MNRDVVLVVYAVALGWCLNTWWRYERERIAFMAADQVRAQAEIDAALHRQSESAPANAEASPG